MGHTLRGHLVFSARTGLFGVPSEWASEVVNLPALTRVPGAPLHMLGIFAHRGELLPVIDLLVLSRTGGTSAPGAWSRAVVIRGAGTAVAFASTKVFGVATLEGQSNPIASSGVHQHLLGPLRSQQGDVFAIEPDGLIEFLARNTA